MVDPAGAVDPAEPAGVDEPPRADVEGVGLDPAGFVGGCDCDVVTGGLRVDVVLRFVACASEAGAIASKKVRTNSVVTKLFVAARSVTAE